MQFLKSLMTAGAALTLIACGSGSNDRQVALSVAVDGANASALTVVTTTPSPDGLTLSDGTNTLVIAKAEVVLREIELKRDDASECGASDGGVLSTRDASGASLTAEGADDPADHDIDDDHGDDDDRDDCEKFETGARVVSLPLDGSVSQQVVAAVPAGTYDRLEFEIHKLSDDNGSEILRQRSDLEDVSIHVEGTFNGEPFMFISDESFEQRVELSPPLVVDADGTDLEVTLAIDLAAWFANAEGMLVDPSADAEHIEDGIDGTFACFEDDDHDGHDDDDDHSGPGN